MYSHFKNKSLQIIYLFVFAIQTPDIVDEQSYTYVWLEFSLLQTLEKHYLNCVYDNLSSTD